MEAKSEPEIRRVGKPEELPGVMGCHAEPDELKKCTVPRFVFARTQYPFDEAPETRPLKDELVTWQGDVVAVTLEDKEAIPARVVATQQITADDERPVLAGHELVQLSRDAGFVEIHPLVAAAHRTKPLTRWVCVVPEHQWPGLPLREVWLPTLSTRLAPLSPTQAASLAPVPSPDELPKLPRRPLFHGTGPALPVFKVSDGPKLETVETCPAGLAAHLAERPGLCDLSCLFYAAAAIVEGRSDITRAVGDRMRRVAYAAYAAHLADGGSVDADDERHRRAFWARVSQLDVAGPRNALEWIGRAYGVRFVVVTPKSGGRVEQFGDPAADAPRGYLLDWHDHLSPVLARTAVAATTDAAAAASSSSSAVGGTSFRLFAPDETVDRFLVRSLLYAWSDGVPVPVFESARVSRLDCRSLDARDAVPAASSGTTADVERAYLYRFGAEPQERFPRWLVLETPCARRVLGLHEVVSVSGRSLLTPFAYRSPEPGDEPDNERGDDAKGSSFRARHPGMVVATLDLGTRPSVALVDRYMAVETLLR